MLVDLSDVTMRIDPDQFPGEVVFRTLTIDLLGEPPIVLIEHGSSGGDTGEDTKDEQDGFRTTIEGAVYPFNGDGTAPLTAQTVDYRLPFKVEDYLVTSWSCECAGMYVAHVLCVVEQGDKFWVGINNEDDLGISDYSDGLTYIKTKYEAYEATFSFEKACAQILLT